MSASPSAASVAHRARLSAAFSELRRVRPRVPFWELSAHRVPTLWSLYRGLLREAPSNDVYFQVRKAFRDNKHLTSATATREELIRGHKSLDAFRKAKKGDERLQRILERYSRLVAVRREKDRWRDLILKEQAWHEKLLNRPILTGSFIRASVYNKPLPRLKPQPIHITGMINRRRKTRAIRGERFAMYQEWMEFLKYEERFEAGLTRVSMGMFEPIFTGHMNEWYRPINEVRASIRKSFELDSQRENAPYTPELLEVVTAARREKLANKTRERLRELRGEDTKHSFLRKRAGPPAHVLARMTPEERRLDFVSRSLSEVGYVAAVKKRLGFKLREPDLWRVELGEAGDKVRLQSAKERLESENKRIGGE
ncbi:hypothetical protein GLOTRDRAFT_81826 [Gloeophyllum trabeum ATCC 11539]|uniref:Uncharacterized protein n=1 Tax=Gloeophyllum trabeum (strain ATCC 11539 / FP-39264 / Madison 617) TaxID=670483 RepID=S7R8W7_GLOTA|nr:uncharacterized protein GLOTRDRAFT_81826 [Gloeophyllum trabeum ATCC 11539]EPQ50755.1 hypothetical protein GLOTRDRAFT_81826 [Gloeophyllum trabeum ATCC 11539]